MNIHPGIIGFLRSARWVTILTGAGISAESGIPTCRDALTGLWSQFRPDELASPQAFARNPKLVWDWYAWRRGMVARAQPNPGHMALVEIESRVPRFTLLTQNVDGLHQRAGSGFRFPVIELHGNITRVVCSGARYLVSAWDENGDIPPICPQCGEQLRPDVVWFGENLPPEALAAAWEAASGCDLFLSIGTSGIVEPAASLPVMALNRGGPVIEINPEPTPLTPYASAVVTGPAGEILPQLVKLTWG